MSARLHYLCSEGHKITTPSNLPQRRCPGYEKGKPCPGELRLVTRARMDSATTKPRTKAEAR